MLHELRDDPSDEDQSRWIPIREDETISTDVPFDFATDRILIVPRSSTGNELDTARLQDDLRRRITALVEAKGID